MRKLITGFGFVLFAGILTLFGFRNSLGQKAPSDLSVAIWFPWAAITKRLTGDDMALLVSALLQFPLLVATAIILGKKFGWKLAIAGVVLAHAAASLTVMGLTRAPASGF